MPTSSCIPITPGTLCWLRSNIPENDGALVTAVSYNGILSGGYKSWEGAKVWTVTAKVPLVLADVNNSAARRVAWVGEEIKVPEMLLVPIAGPGLVDEVTAYDKKVRYKSVAELQPTFGARSTPNVRR